VPENSLTSSATCLHGCRWISFLLAPCTLLLAAPASAEQAEVVFKDTTLHFGLGQHKAPVSLDIFWPNKSRQTITDVEINRLVTIHFTASP